MRQRHLAKYLARAECFEKLLFINQPLMLQQDLAAHRHCRHVPPPAMGRNMHAINNRPAQQQQQPSVAAQGPTHLLRPLVRTKHKQASRPASKLHSAAHNHKHRCSPGSSKCSAAARSRPLAKDAKDAKDLILPWHRVGIWQSPSWVRSSGG